MNVRSVENLVKNNTKIVYTLKKKSLRTNFAVLYGTNLYRETGDIYPGG